MSTVVRVDYSTLKTVATCDTRTALRHVLGMSKPHDEEDGAMAAGTAAHEALACRFQGGTIDDAMAKFGALYAPTAARLNPGLYPWQERLTLQNTSAIMLRWFETHPLEHLEFQVRADLVEVGFTIPLLEHNGVSIQLIGRCDAIVERMGDLYVCDHKTTGRIDATFRREFRGDAQMTTYVWAATETLGQRVRGIYINGIEFCKLPASEKKCTKHKLRYAECGPEHATFEILQTDRSDVQLVDWEKTTRGLALRYVRLLDAVGGGEIAAVQQLAMQGTFNKACRWCPFDEFCNLHERNAPNLLIHNPWNPLARK